MIQSVLSNEIVNKLIDIELNLQKLESLKIPAKIFNWLQDSSRKRSSYASNAIEGNPLNYEQAEQAIESKSRHFLKPEQEIRNYYAAIELLSKRLSEKTPFSLSLILEARKVIVEGESKEKVGIRGPMPAGVLFAVYDTKTGKPEYIPPEASDVRPLLDELVDYIRNSDDHPIIKAAIVHYQLVTIHPFEDGNGRTARIMSNYVLSYYGYGFKEIGSLEEYFAYNLEEYYSSLQMGLPALYYSGRDNPPHPEIWINYFLKVFALYAKKVVAIASSSVNEDDEARLHDLTPKAKAFLAHLRKDHVKDIIPIEEAKKFGVSNRTIINWCTELAAHGFLTPNLIKKRIRSYSLVN